MLVEPKYGVVSWSPKMGSSAVGLANKQMSTIFYYYAPVLQWTVGPSGEDGGAGTGRAGWVPSEGVSAG